MESSELTTQDCFTYKRTRGEANDAGIEYENKIATLLYFRGQKANCNFSLGTGVKDAGKFDDVVFNYKGINQKTIFLQLKHSEKSQFNIKRFFSAKANKRYFCLQQYFHSFCDLKIMYDERKTPDWWGNFENFEFILFTNKAIDMLNCSMLYEVDKNDALDTGGCVYKLKDDVKESLINGADTEVEEYLIEEFIEKFALYTNQKSECDINNIIKNEIVKTYNVSDIRASEILHRVLGEIRNLRNEDECEVITENKWVFSNGDHMVNSINSKEELVSIHYQLEDGVLQNFEKDLNDSENAVNVIENAAPIWCSVLAYNSLIIFGDHTVMVRLQTLEEEESLQEIQTVWPSDWCQNLIILIKKEEMDSRFNLQKKIMKLMQNATKSRKIILVVESLETVNFLENQYNTIHLPCDFKNLTKDSKMNILEKTVNFQGFSVQLKELIEEEAENILNCNALNELLLLTDGHSIGGIYKPLEHYISRKLKHHVYVDIDILKEECDGIYALSQNYKINEQEQSGKTKINFNLLPVPQPILMEIPAYEQKQVTVSYKISFVRNVIDVSNKRQYDELCSKNSTVHLLEPLGDKLRWKESHGDMSTIQKYNYTDIGDTYSVSTVYDIPEKTVLLISEAGMGKTSLLNELAYNTKARDPHAFIIHLKLQDSIPFLQKLDKDKIETKKVCHDHIVDFLLSSYSSDYSVIWKRICDSNLRNGKKIILLIDGYDEVIPKYEDIVTNLLVEINKMNIHKMWITSRPNAKEILERKLETLSHALDIFNIEDQQKFFYNRWTSETVDKSKIDDCFSAIIKIFKDQTFFGIPLHCEIVAEVFQPHLNSADFESEISEISTELNLYEEFVKKKFQCYCDKYCLYSGNSYEHQTLLEDHEKKYVNDHMNAAILLYYLATGDKNLKLVVESTKVTEFLKTVETGKEKTGLISFVQNGVPQFVHRKVAEFLGAKYFSENIFAHETIIKNIMKGKDISETRHILNLLLYKDLPLHKAIYSLDKEKVKQLLTLDDSKSGILNTDKLGRTVLHVAVGKCPYLSDKDVPTLVDIIKETLKHGADVNCTDILMKFTPFQYLRFNISWSVMELFLETNSVRKKHINSFNKFLWKKNNYCLDIGVLFAVSQQKKTLLKFLLRGSKLYKEDEVGNKIQYHSLLCAIRTNKVDMLKYLIEDLQINEMVKPPTGETILHDACIAGDQEIVKYLVEKRKINPNVKTVYGKSAVAYAAEKNQLHLLKYFHEEININMKESKDNYGHNLLFFTSNIDCVQYLVEKCGVDPKVPEKFRGSLPIHKACEDGLWNIVDYYIESCKIDINVTDNFSNTCLHFAGFLNHDITNFLNKYKKVINFDALNSHSQNAFFFAVKNGSVNAAKCLAKICDTNNQDIQGNTCLHIVVKNPLVTVDALKFLVEECGVDPNIKNNMNETSLDIAVNLYELHENRKVVLMADYSIIQYLKSVTKE